MAQGGKRAGAGRPKGSNSWGEPTKAVRIPLSRINGVRQFLEAGNARYAFGQIHLAQKLKFSKLSSLKRGAGNEIKRRLLGTSIYWL